MTFRCDPATLERLEWQGIVQSLSACAATDRGREACRDLAFCATRGAVGDRLRETGEARVLLDGAEALPFGGVRDIRATVAGARRGELLTPAELSDTRGTVDSAQRLRRFLAERSEIAPALADLAMTLPDLGALARAIDRVITPEAEVRDDASPALKKLRRSVRDLEGEVDRRMAALLRDASVRPHLQDSYVTTREDRPVLPVRAEARGAVRGIVHDISSSGTTVFIEPEAIVETGNRLRVARRECEREIERLLRELGAQVAGNAEELEAMGATLEALDQAQARGRLSQQLDARAPELGEAAPLALRALRHPLLLLQAGLTHEQVIANDVALAPGTRGLVISGPNAGGKTVAAKAVGLAALCVRAGLHVACGDESSLPLFDAVHADIGDEQDLRSGLSTFSARMANLARIVESADADSLVIVDEIGEGTEPGEGAALAQAILETLVERGAWVVATTHFNRLKELAGSDRRFANASAEFDPETLLPTFRIHLGAPGSSGATWVAGRMGLGPDVVARAQALLDREDRRLEALTRSLSELRQELLAERELAGEMREQTEAARERYEARLTQLRSAREQALAAMRGELDAAFDSARAELAAVMRDVQQGGAASGRAANRAYRRLQAIEERTAEAEARHAPEAAEGSSPRPLDWDGVEPGARLELEGIRGEAILVSPPDRKGRVVVRVGGARTDLPATRVRRVLAERPPETAPRPAGAAVALDREAPPEEVTPECDLRGLRVDEALDRAEAHLQSVLGHGVGRVRFIHGHGTGALRSAIRAWLRDLPDVSSYAPGADREGGNGVTVATLSH